MMQQFTGICWEERASSPRPATSYLQGIDIPAPGSPLSFLAYFQDIDSTSSFPQSEHLMQSFQRVDSAEKEQGSVASLPIGFYHQNQRVASVSSAYGAPPENPKPLSKDRRYRKRLKERDLQGPAVPLRIGLDKKQWVLVSSTAGAFDASRNRKPLSKDQRYRKRRKEKEELKDRSFQEKIEMQNEEISRIRRELKLKNEEIASLRWENDVLRKENKRHEKID